jgi:hypothetical protein
VVGVGFGRVAVGGGMAALEAEPALRPSRLSDADENVDERVVKRGEINLPDMFSFSRRR